jgi:ADP-ribose pyrophosphatase YjhB (NUDIX family)
MKLASASNLRFSELQPPHIPNNSFSYHLKKLHELGYIEATPTGYTATRKGLKAVQNIGNRLSSGQPVALTVLYVTNDQGEVLLLERGSRPFKHWLGVPSGLICNGESLKQAAARELKEKVSVTVTLDELNPKGVLDFRYLQHNSKDMFIHALGFVFTYQYVGPRDLLEGRETKFGTLCWADTTAENILPEVAAVASLVNQETTFIHSIDFEEPTPILDPLPGTLL